MRRDKLHKEIASISDQLVKKYKAEKIILFGSAATGRVTADSDLDFLVIKDEKKSFHDRVTAAYRLVKTRMATDFLVYTPKEFADRLRLGDPFIRSVLVTGKVLYG